MVLLLLLLSWTLVVLRFPCHVFVYVKYDAVPSCAHNNLKFIITGQGVSGERVERPNRRRRRRWWWWSSQGGAGGGGERWVVYIRRSSGQGN